MSSGRFLVRQGREAIAQKVAIRLGTYRGEWFLDTTFGVPWREDILVRNPDLSAIGALIRSEIVKTEGVIGIRTFDLDLTDDRKLLIDFVAETLEGDVRLVTPEEGVSPAAIILLLAPVGPIRG